MHTSAASLAHVPSGPLLLTHPQTLGELQQRHPEASLCFVEDKVETLRSVANELTLLGVKLYFAEWGYSTAEQQARACQWLSLSLSRALSPSFSLALSLSLSLSSCATSLTLVCNLSVSPNVCGFAGSRVVDAESSFADGE